MEYANYDLQDEDPYLISGSTCLINSLGITDTKRLSLAEGEISTIAHAELIQSPIKPTFDLDHLCRIHRHLFGDIYAWAGTLRATEIGKGGKLFLPYRLIQQCTDELFNELHQEGLLSNLPIRDFAIRSAYYLGRINAIHPFREGNGRTQRILLDQLAERAGYSFEWAAVSGEQMAVACRAARQDNPEYVKLARLLQLHIIRL